MRGPPPPIDAPPEDARGAPPPPETLRGALMEGARGALIEDPARGALMEGAAGALGIRGPDDNRTAPGEEIEGGPATLEIGTELVRAPDAAFAGEATLRFATLGALLLVGMGSPALVGIGNAVAPEGDVGPVTTRVGPDPAFPFPLPQIGRAHV